MKWFSKLKAKATPKEVPEVEEYQLKDKELEKLSASFVSPDEKYIASLGNGYIMNYLANKSAKKGFAFITDKRVYFKGSCLSGTGKHLVKSNEERTVDVKNITGSGFTYHRYWGILIALFISILVSIGGAILGVALSKQIHFVTYSSRINSPEDRIYWETLLNKIDTFEWIVLDYERGSIWATSDNEILYTIVIDTIGIDNNHLTIWRLYNSDVWEYILAASDDEIICNVNLRRIEISVSDGSYYVYGDALDGLWYDNENGKKIDDMTSLPDILEITKEMIKYEIKDFQVRPIKNNLINFAETTLIVIADTLAIAFGLSLVIVCCINLKKYLLSRKTLFRIEYAGGCIAFDVSFYAKAEIDDFQKQLRRAKDIAEENNEVKAVTVETPTETSAQSNVADDLRKYAELLKEGLITQEEYDAMKKKVLGL